MTQFQVNYFLIKTIETEDVIKYFISFFQEYQPRMEVMAVGFDYDNETATMRVSVFVGIPTIDGSRYSPNLSDNFTNYEIYLTAVKEESENNNFPYPPSSCLSDSFLQHSRRDVFVDDCSSLSLSSELNNTLELATSNPAAVIPWETLCVDQHAV